MFDHDHDSSDAGEAARGGIGHDTVGRSFEVAENSWTMDHLTHFEHFPLS